MHRTAQRLCANLQYGEWHQNYRSKMAAASPCLERSKGRIRLLQARSTWRLSPYCSFTLNHWVRRPSAVQDCDIFFEYSEITMVNDVKLTVSPIETVVNEASTYIYLWVVNSKPETIVGKMYWTNVGNELINSDFRHHYKMADPFRKENIFYYIWMVNILKNFQYIVIL